MNPEVEKIYKDYVSRLKDFADDADCLTDGNKSKFSNLLIKEYNRDLSRIVKRETFVHKIINKLFKRKLRAMKREAVSKEQQEQSQEPVFSCGDCINCTVLDGLPYCLVHKLVFETAERERQFCLLFCRSYQKDVSDDEQCTPNDDAADVSEEDTEESKGAILQQTDSNEEEPESSVDGFIPCEKCPHCTKDEYDQYYCNRYDEELDPDTVADVRQCEE